MSTNNNDQSEPLTKEKLIQIFWDNFEKALKDLNMSHRDFANAVNMNEKTLGAMIKRKSCPDIWFMALAKEILKYDCTQMLYHYNARRYETILSEKEDAVLALIRKGDIDEQNRKLDVITAFLRYADDGGNILGTAIPDNRAPSMGAFDNTSKRKKTIRRKKTNTIEPAQPAPAPAPATEPEVQRPRRITVIENPDQTFFPFFDDIGNRDSDN